jgi:TPP-dependent pyruvate/acetoin dehydrogenase alpha subunit
LSNEQFDQLDKQAKQTVLDSVKFAEQSPQLPVDELYNYVYFNGAKS